MKVTFKLEGFEGPLDLLLHLIDKAEVDIYDIPIKEITDQYLEVLAQMQELELDVTSDFLVMAATLLSIKSQMLLPKPPVIDFDEYDEMDDDYDPRAELVEKLLEYRKFKEAADHLRTKEVERGLLFTREPSDLSPYIPELPVNPVEGLALTDLLRAFQKALRRQAGRHIITKIHRDEISVKDRIRQVVDVLKAKGGKLLFSRLLDEETTRQDIVVTFLALLELMKMKQITCYQDKLFDDIVIESREEELGVGLQTDEINY